MLVRAEASCGILAGFLELPEALGRAGVVLDIICAGAGEAAWGQKARMKENLECCPALPCSNEGRMVKAGMGFQALQILIRAQPAHSLWHWIFISPLMRLANNWMSPCMAEVLQWDVTEPLAQLSAGTCHCGPGTRSFDLSHTEGAQCCWITLTDKEH